MSPQTCCQQVRCRGLSVELDAMALRAFRHLVEERAGLAVAAERQADLVAALRQGICETQSQDAGSYFQKLELEVEHGKLLSRLVAKMLPGETYFFRDRNQLELLRREVLQPLRQRLRPGQTVRLWSAGCSTGEEAWTLAFLAQEELAAQGVAFEVIGTDLQPESLSRAAAGDYRAWSFRGLSDADRQRWFEPSEMGLSVRRDVRQDLRDRVRFYQHDLQSWPAEPWMQSGFDLILCRNVFIYYLPSVVRATMDRLACALRPDGGLILGHNEAGGHVPAGLQAQVLADSVIFRRGPGLQSRAPTPAPAPRGHFAPAWETPKPSAPLGQRSPPAPPPRPGSPETLEEHRSRSLRLLEQGDAAGARRLAEQGLAQYSSDLQLLVVSARAEANLGRLTQAEHLVTLGLARHPMSADLQFLHSLLLVERGNGRGALAILEKLRFSAPEFAAAHVHRARMYEDARAADLAAESWGLARKALAKVDPTSAVPWFESLNAAQLLNQVEVKCGNSGVGSRWVGDDR